MIEFKDWRNIKCKQDKSKKNLELEIWIETKSIYFIKNSKQIHVIKRRVIKPNWWKEAHLAISTTLCLWRPSGAIHTQRKTLIYELCAYQRWRNSLTMHSFPLSQEHEP